MESREIGSFLWGGGVLGEKTRERNRYRDMICEGMRATTRIRISDKLHPTPRLHLQSPDPRGYLEYTKEPTEHGLRFTFQEEMDRQL